MSHTLMEWPVSMQEHVPTQRKTINEFINPQYTSIDCEIVRRQLINQGIGFVHYLSY